MKLTITFQSGSLAGQFFEVTDKFLTIGRSPDCSIRFAQSERVISSNHAYIQFQGDGYYLVDNNSTNGSFVNGVRVQKAKLNSGDTVMFGKQGASAIINIQQAAPAFEIPQVNQVFTAAPQAPAAAQAGNFMKSMSHIGLHVNNADKQPKSNTGKYIGIGIAFSIVAVLLLLVTVLNVASLGLIPAIIATFVAFLPAAIYIFPVIWLDRYDPEPIWLLALAFAWGGLVSIIFSGIVNSIFAANFGDFAAGVISAPIFEEASKGFGLLLILIFFRREFDDILDGIVYAGVIALGFAAMENVQYYGEMLINNGFKGLLFLVILRGVLSPFAHVTFTAMTGIGCGISRESHNPLVRFIMPVIGYCFAVALHATWNLIASVGELDKFLVGYIILEVPFFLIFVGFSIYIMRRQNKILKDMLAIDVARGLISQEQLDIATSGIKSFFWVLGGKFRARRAFLRAIGKLGLSYWHIQRATAAQGQTGSFQQNPILRDEVLKWRDEV